MKYYFNISFLFLLVFYYTSIHAAALIAYDSDAAARIKNSQIKSTITIVRYYNLPVVKEIKNQKRFYNREGMLEVFDTYSLNSDQLFSRTFYFYNSGKNITEVKTMKPVSTNMVFTKEYLDNPDTTLSGTDSIMYVDCVTKYKYDSHNNIVEKSMYNPLDGMYYCQKSIIIYKDDKKTEKNTYETFSGNKSSEKYYYNSKNQLIKTEFIDSTGKISDVMLTQRDSVGRAIRNDHYRGDGSYNAGSENIFDVNGKLLERRQYNEKRELTFTYKHMYDSLGNSIETNWHNDVNKGQITLEKRLLDSAGNIKDEHLFDEKGVLIRETRFIYEYYSK